MIPTNARYFTKYHQSIFYRLYAMCQGQYHQDNIIRLNPRAGPSEANKGLQDSSRWAPNEGPGITQLSFTARKIRGGSMVLAYANEKSATNACLSAQILRNPRIRACGVPLGGLKEQTDIFKIIVNLIDPIEQ